MHKRNENRNTPKAERRGERVQTALSVMDAMQIVGIDVDVACDEICACIRAGHFSVDELEDAKELYKRREPEQLAEDKKKSMELAEAILLEIGITPGIRSGAAH